ncbi:hypothetical protein BGZ83_009530 [Gryganskiella cystojenkinii]|nr:hypothetical protein BGZ83_009530 [Gryganskiella cystojenkinii]
MDRATKNEPMTASTSSSAKDASISDTSRPQQPLQKQQQQQPSIFLKPKKPTHANIGSRPLLKPFKNDSIDYSNPGKHDPKPIASRGPTAFAPGVPISLPGSNPSTLPPAHASSSASSATSSPSFSKPKPTFSFDNHTDDSWKDEHQRSKDRPASSLSNRGAKRSLSNEDDENATKAGGASSSTTGKTENEGLTILRIKRRRNEEPLDTLVVQQQMDKLAGKKSKRLVDEVQREIENALAGNVSLPKPPPAVFRLATTVNKESFKDPTQSLQLRDKITHLAESSLSSRSSAPSSRPRSRIGERHPSEFGERVQERQGKLAEFKREEARTARYRVINKNRAGLNSEKDLPPQVKTSVEVEAEAALDMFKMYDAVKEEEPKSKKQIAKEKEDDEIMCNFLPMVREYLSISDQSKGASDPKITVDPAAGDLSTRSSLLARSAEEKPRPSGYDEAVDAEDSDEEFVYDIYVRDDHADYTQESMHQRSMGSLQWFSDDENNIMNEDDSSDEDFEDSDSNAEDYYQNDYPEDELSDEDHAYELSASDNEDEYMY